MDEEFDGANTLEKLKKKIKKIKKIKPRAKRREHSGP